MIPFREASVIPAIFGGIPGLQLSSQLVSKSQKLDRKALGVFISKLRIAEKIPYFRQNNTEIRGTGRQSLPERASYIR